MKLVYIPFAIAVIGIVLAIAGIFSIAGASGQVINTPALSQISGIYSMFGVGFIEIAGGIGLAVLGWFLAKRTPPSG